MARTASPPTAMVTATSGRAPSNFRRYSESPQPPTIAAAAAAAASAISNAATAGTNNTSASNNTITTTATTASLSKRDKRRSVISEKLQDLTAAFADNRDQHYRAQVQACQIDMSLILLADPYANAPLADSSEEIAEMVGGAAVVPPAQQVQQVQQQQLEGGKMGEGGMGAVAAAVGGAGAGIGAALGAEAHQAEQLAAQVGRQYARFASEVNDALEERDVALTMLNTKYENTLSELQQTHRYKVLLAEEEHRLLASTIRERLVQALSQKRSRLLRDKEQLDLADSNALLLHPNQFSINDPASPGGQQNNRKTRHTRHRIDPEELSSAAVAQENKRKRKAAFEETEAGSPGPSIGGRPATATTAGVNAATIANNTNDTYAGSPYREARAKMVHTQFEAPLYSLDRLFTEKELSMVMNNAHIAATHFFTKLQAQGNGKANATKMKDNNNDNNSKKGIGSADGAGDDSDTQGNGVEPGGNNNGDADATASGTPAARDSVEPMDQDIPDAAPEMDRGANTSSMTTRGSTRNNNNNATNGNVNNHINSNNYNPTNSLNPLNPANASTATILGNPANTATIANNSTIIPGASPLLNPASANLNDINNNNNNTLFPPTTLHHHHHYQPIILPANIGSRANAAAPVPPALNQGDVEYDLALMARTGKSNEALNKQLLERACGPLVAREYAYRAPGGGPGGAAGAGASAGVFAGVGGGGGFGIGVADDSLAIGGPGAADLGLAGLLDVPAAAAAAAGSGGGAGGLGAGGLGGIPMSAQSSIGGLSEIGGGAGAGGVAMSRQSSARAALGFALGGSGAGGVGMRRTASANASTGGARARNRGGGH